MFFKGFSDAFQHLLKVFQGVSEAFQIVYDEWRWEAFQDRVVSRGF